VKAYMVYEQQFRIRGYLWR